MGKSSINHELENSVRGKELNNLLEVPEHKSYVEMPYNAVIIINDSEDAIALANSKKLLAGRNVKIFVKNHAVCDPKILEGINVSEIEIANEELVYSGSAYARQIYNVDDYKKNHAFLQETVKDIDPNLSETEKFNIISQRLAEHIEYPYDVLEEMKEKWSMENLELTSRYTNSANLNGAREGKALCVGQAVALQEALGMVGIESVAVEGSVRINPNSTSSHAWNIVKLDGKCYQHDQTWVNEQSKKNKIPVYKTPHFLRDMDDDRYIKVDDKIYKERQVTEKYEIVQENMRVKAEKEETPIDNGIVSEYLRSRDSFVLDAYFKGQLSYEDHRVITKNKKNWQENVQQRVRIEKSLKSFGKNTDDVNPNKIESQHENQHETFAASMYVPPENRLPMHANHKDSQELQKVKEEEGPE